MIAVQTDTFSFYRLLRVSSQGQRDRYGLPAQRRATEDLVAGLPNGPHTIADTAVIVEGAGAWVRQDWANAVSEGLRQFRRREINAFLLPRVDRETRNLFASIPILKEVLDAGILVYFAEENICLTPNDPEAIQKYLESAMEAAAYLRRLVKNTTMGRITRAKDDQKHPTNRALFGFVMVEGKRVPRPAEANALREAAQIALKQGRLRPAAAYLNSLGFRSSNGRPFTSASLGGKRSLFRNPALIGQTTIYFKKEEEPVVIQHEPILDRATFEQLQQLIEGRRLRAPRSTAFYALSGIAFCACGAKFSGTKAGNHRYYRCGKNCGQKPWSKDRLEVETWGTFVHYLERKEGQRQHLELAQQSRAKLEKDLRELETQITKSNREWRVLLDKELADYPDLIIKEKKRELIAESESLLRARAKIEDELAALPEVDPDELERALDELSKAFAIGNRGGYGIPSPMSWERAREIDSKLPEEQGRLLRETLLRLNCRITVQGNLIAISGRLPLGLCHNNGNS